MAIQAVSGQKLFVALVALEWSFPCVGPATEAACQLEVKICTNFVDSF
jgi:hypothetical protein